MKIRYYMLMHRRFYKYLIENISKRYETMMEIVKACCENQEMVIVKYDENDEDLFLCGYRKHYNEEEVIMKCVNERGQYDGYAMLMSSRIWRMNYKELMGKDKS